MNDAIALIKAGFVVGLAITAAIVPVVLGIIGLAWAFQNVLH